MVIQVTGTRMPNFHSKMLLRQNHQKSQWQLRQVACFFGVFSYARTHIHIYATGSKTVRVVVLISGNWGGARWGGNNTNRVYGYATWSSLAPHAALLDFHLHFHDLHLHFMLHYLIFTCTFIDGVGWGGDNTNRVYGYATWSSLALHATLLDFHLHFHWWGGVGWA